MAGRLAVLDWDVGPLTSETFPFEYAADGRVFSGCRFAFEATRHTGFYLWNEMQAQMDDEGLEVEGESLVKHILFSVGEQPMTGNTGPGVRATSNGSHVAEISTDPTRTDGVEAYAVDPDNARRLWEVSEQLLETRFDL